MPSRASARPARPQPRRVETSAARPAGRYAAERLEQRLLLASDFAAVAAVLDQRLAAVDVALDPVDKAAPLPVVNRSLGSFAGAHGLVKAFRGGLAAGVKALGKSPSPDKIRQAVFAALAAVDPKLLADADGNGTVDAKDVAVTPGAGDDVTVQVDLKRTVSLGSTKFGLALPGLPFGKLGGSVGASLDFAFDDLTFGWAGGAAFFGGTTDRVRLGLSASVAAKPISGNLGFARFTATDANPAPELSVGFAVDLGSDGSAVGVPTATGAALVKLHLTAAPETLVKGSIVHRDASAPPTDRAPTPRNLPTSPGGQGDQPARQVKGRRRRARGVGGPPRGPTALILPPGGGRRRRESLRASPTTGDGHGRRSQINRLALGTHQMLTSVSNPCRQGFSP